MSFRPSISRRRLPLVGPRFSTLSVQEQNEKLAKGITHCGICGKGFVEAHEGSQKWVCSRNCANAMCKLCAENTAASTAECPFCREGMTPENEPELEVVDRNRDLSSSDIFDAPTDAQGQIPIIEAAKHGDVSEAKRLLDDGKRQHITNLTSLVDIEGSTALYYAIANNNIRMVNILLEYGADPDQKHPSDGSTGLFLAVAAATNSEHTDIQLEVVEALLGKSNDVNISREDGATPLHVATIRNSLDVVKALLRHGADANVNYMHSTPLHMAVREGYVAVVKALLSKDDVNTEALDIDNQTPLQVAVREGYVAVVKALLSKGADPNCGALHDACYYGNLYFVKALLHHGADANLVYHGRTPLAIARDENNLDVVTAIEEHNRKRKRSESGCRLM